MAAPRRTTTRKPAATKVVAPINLDEDAGPEQDFDEREPLFSLRGKVYDIPVRIPAGAALQYTLIGIERGLDAAIAYALNYALGNEGRQALVSHAKLTDVQLGKVILAVRAKFDGAMVAPKAQPSTG